MPLLAGIYFLNQPFQPIRLALAEVPKLNYKCSPHGHFRIWVFTSRLVEISWSSRGFYVAEREQLPWCRRARI